MDLVIQADSSAADYSGNCVIVQGGESSGMIPLCWDQRGVVAEHSLEGN